MSSCCSKYTITITIDQLEQYSRRTSVRISGVNESELGENLTTVVTDMRANINPDMPRLTMADMNRVHRVGQKKRQDPHTARATTTSQAHTGAIQRLQWQAEYNAFKKANSGNNATRIHSRGLNPISGYIAVQSTSGKA